MFSIGKSIVTKRKIKVCLGLGVCRYGMTTNGTRFLFAVMKMF